MSIRTWDSRDWLGVFSLVVLVSIGLLSGFMVYTTGRARVADAATRHRIAPGVDRVFDPEFGVVCYVRDIGISCLKAEAVPAEKP